MCCRKIVLNGYLVFKISVFFFKTIFIQNSDANHSNIKYQISKYFPLTWLIQWITVCHLLYTPFSYFTPPIFPWEWKKERVMGHFHLLKMKKYYLHLPRWKMIEVWGHSFLVLLLSKQIHITLGSTFLWYKEKFVDF